MMKARHLALLVLSIAAGCQRPTEVHGAYAYLNGFGSFFSCDDPNTVVYVPDTVLATRYRSLGDSSGGLAYVRLRGLNTRSGSIYSGRPYFVVQQILEIRPRTKEDCAKITPPGASVLAP